jgi:signal transduction histidine kinase
MNWITVICAMIAAACLTVGGIHLLVWFRLRRAKTSLLLANLALASAVFVGFNIAIMHARTPENAAVVLRWMYLPLSWGLVSMLLFVRQYLGTGRNWLMWTALGSRAITVAVNFATSGSLILHRVTRIDSVSILGERLSIPTGEPSRLLLLGNASAALFLACFADASILAWREQRRRSALLVSGVLIPAFLVGLVPVTVLAVGGPPLPSPFLLSLAPFAVLLAMGFALSSELLRSEVLARELRESHERMGAAASELDRVSRLTAMGEFAAALAHETIQPITAMILEAKSALLVLPKDGTGDDARIGLESIVESGQRAAQVIKRNRELFRHRTVRTVPLKINEVIVEARSLAGWRLNDSDVSIEMTLASGLPAIAGDRVELQQVLLNLIANAIDAIEGRPNPRVWIRSTPVDDSVCIEIGDNGVGLGDVDTQRMFSLSYTTKPNGTGVGLSVSRAIVNAHGGRIWAQANSEGGASFYVSLPRQGTSGAERHEDFRVSGMREDRVDVGKADPHVPDAVAYPRRLERELERVVDQPEVRRGDRT